jgi:hypothetical protein
MPEAGAQESAPVAAAPAADSGPDTRTQFEISFRETLESRFHGGELEYQSKQILSKFGYATLSVVPAEKFGDLIAAASVAVK